MESKFNALHHPEKTTFISQVMFCDLLFSVNNVISIFLFLNILYCIIFKIQHLPSYNCIITY